MIEDVNIGPSNGFELTIIVRGKHGFLHNLAKAAGSQKNLAEAMGVPCGTLNGWINLKKYPKQPSEDLKSMLLVTTGRAFDELFPLELRNMIDQYGGKAMQLEATQTMELKWLTERREDRALLPDPSSVVEEDELKEHVREVLTTLSSREKSVLELRFGLGGDPPKGIEEVAELFHVTRDRIRQIEAKAMRKMQDPHRAGKLVGHTVGQALPEPVVVIQKVCDAKRQSICPPHEWVLTLLCGHTVRATGEGNTSDPPKTFNCWRCEDEATAIEGNKRMQNFMANMR